MAAMAWIFHRSGRRAGGLVTAFVAASSLLSSAHAEPVMTEVTALARAYGAGVHAYFSGDAQRAYDDLTQAIEAGTSDPRAWYFRGLAALKLGRLDEAEADFSTAATRETEAAGDWGVGRSLERVQGPGRLALERHRVRARVAGLEQRRQAVQRRYSDIESRQDEVQRQRRPAGVTRDPTEQFGGEDVSAPPVTTPPATGEPVEPAEAGDGVREPPAEEMPAEELPVQPEAGDAVEPPAEPAMEEENPAPEAAPVADAPAEAAEEPMAEEREAPAEGDAPAEEDEAPPAPAQPADEPMAEEGEAPAAPDAPGSEVFDK